MQALTHKARRRREAKEAFDSDNANVHFCRARLYTYFVDAIGPIVHIGELWDARSIKNMLFTCIPR